MDNAELYKSLELIRRGEFGSGKPYLIVDQKKHPIRISRVIMTEGVGFSPIAHERTLVCLDQTEGSVNRLGIELVGRVTEGEKFSLFRRVDGTKEFLPRQLIDVFTLEDATIFYTNMGSKITWESSLSSDKFWESKCYLVNISDQTPEFIVVDYSQPVGKEGWFYLGTDVYGMDINILPSHEESGSNKIEGQILRQVRENEKEKIMSKLADAFNFGDKPVLWRN